MDEIIKIQCPFCSAVLSVKNTPGIEQKYVTCPVCKHKHLFTEYKYAKNTKFKPNGDSDTKYPGDDDMTKPFNSGDPNTTILTDGVRIIGRLHLLGTNVTFQLKNGINIIGRLSNTPNADFLIDTGDKRHMSRQHLKVEVVNANGHIIHRISLFKQHVNETAVNNQRLEFGDCIILSNGDVINMPDATLKFEIPDSDETQIS